MEKKFYLKPETEVLEFETENILVISPGDFDPDQQQEVPVVTPGEGSTVKPAF